MFKNSNNRVFTVEGINIIANMENGAVVGVDKDGLGQYESCESMPIINNDLYSFLTENDFISAEPFDHPKYKLDSAYLHVTNKCNLNCVGCYSNNSERNNRPDLNVNILKDSVKDLVKLGLEILIISGGEPLLYEDIVELVKSAKEDYRVDNLVLITNGTTGNKTLFNELSKYIDTIAVSIDTFSSQSPSFLREEGLHDTILDNVKLMQESGLKVSLLPTINHKNIQYVDCYTKLAESLGADISFSILTTSQAKEFEDFSLNEEDLQLIADYLISKDISIQDAPVNGVLEGKDSCGAGKNIISISATGDVYPCHMMMDKVFSLGSICEESLEEIYKRGVHNITVDDIDGCVSCEYRYLCGGACRARAYMSKGKILGHDPFCSLYCSYYSRLFDVYKRRLSGYEI